MPNTRFYDTLNPFSIFRELPEDDLYLDLPEDWLVFITDVKGSTQAIEEGRYKDVNQIGVAAIAAVQNRLKKVEFPFVFGGDGSTIVVPADYKEAVCEELGALKVLALRAFDLELRAGVVPVSEVYARGGRIEVAKHELVKHKNVAILRGGGLTIAERMIKDPDSPYEIPARKNHVPDLDGLSCRWNPIPSKVGKVLSILVLSREENQPETYRRVLRQLEKIMRRSVDDANPVNYDMMSYKSMGELFSIEGRYSDSWFHPKMIIRAAEIVAAVLVFKHGWFAKILKVPGYGNSMRRHADHRKFDDMLRLVIDCTEEEVEQLKAYLYREYSEEKVFFGVHTSDEALITCLVESVNEGRHIHFIDGGEGGYAMAAKQLKAQIRGAAE